MSFHVHGPAAAFRRPTPFAFARVVLRVLVGAGRSGEVEMSFCLDCNELWWGCTFMSIFVFIFSPPPLTAGKAEAVSRTRDGLEMAILRFP